MDTADRHKRYHPPPNPRDVALARYKIIYAPGHPAMQYHIARTGHDFHILANWEQFQYWRPRPPNVTNLFEAYEDAHLDLTPGDYRRMLADPDNPFGFPDEYDLAWSMWNEQFKIFEGFRSLPKVHRVAKFAELEDHHYRDVFSRNDIHLASYYRYTVDQIAERYGVTIPLVELGLSADDYGPYTGEDPVILSVIHTWSTRGWHYHHYAEATEGLPTLHVDHMNPGPEGPLPYPRILELMRRCRVYYHDGENEYTVALLEAMMSGAPIVTYALPLVERHVQHGVNGFIGHNAQELREYCRMLLDDEDLARKMGAESRRIALERYDERRWIRQWNQIFDDVIAGRGIYT